MQETFARVVEKHGTWRGDTPALHWMYRVTTNYCLNCLRRRRTHPVMADPDALARIAGPAWSGEQARVDRAAVLDVLSRTDAKTQQIAVYYFFDQMKMDEIADVLGTSRKTVGKRLDRFRQRARALLADRPSG